MATIQEQIKELEAKISTTKSEITNNILKAELQKLKLQESASGGNEVSKAILLMKDVLESTKRNVAPTSGISKDDAKKLVDDFLSKVKITKDNLDDELKAYLTSNVKVQLQLYTANFSAPGGKLKESDYNRPLFQKILTDLVAKNNVYLYGGAGTGKTYLASQIAEFMDWNYIELSCNQFTSQLDILGGQTVEGYQPGKLEMAWGNTDEKGNPTKKLGTVLCLDELPKIDPNTAGILNSALAKVRDDKAGVAPYIMNGRNQKIFRHNILIIGTGNVKLNETSTEYEANFKQDLSLQDRFVGSTYEVYADYKFESTSLMKGFLFIWIPLMKLREKIVENKWTGQAFVSMRILTALRDTYIAYRGIKDGTIKPIAGSNEQVEKIKDPKTLLNGVDSFLNLFKPEQIIELQNAMEYADFKRKIMEKDKLPISELDTLDEITKAKNITEAYENSIKNKLS